MCIIVIQPEGHTFDAADIVDFYDHNPHGFGVMFHDGTKPRMFKKVPRDVDEAVSLYFDHAAGRPAVLHYRWATSGPVNKDMAHPFQVSPGLAVVHNGIFSGFGSNKESDTAQVVREVLKPVLTDYRALRDPRVQTWLERFTGGSSLVFMDQDGQVQRFGSRGVTFNGCWYSNTYAWTPPEQRRKLGEGDLSDLRLWEALNDDAGDDAEYGECYACLSPLALEDMTPGGLCPTCQEILDGQ